MIKSDVYDLTLTFVQPILGGQPGNDELARAYLEGKMKKEMKKKPDADAIIEADSENVNDQLEKGTTGFYRDAVTKAPILKGYQIKGMIKESASVLNGHEGFKAFRSKIDNLVFVTPVNLLIENLPNGELTIIERPLRSTNPQGIPQTSIARSECLPEGCKVTCRLEVVQSVSTKITEEVLRDLLDYGTRKGFLQWRNSGMYGGFTYELTKR